MILSLTFLFFLCIVMSFFEDRLPYRGKLYAYLCIAVLMILTAGLRGVGTLPDSEGYESYYNNNDSLPENFLEPSFKLIRFILQSMSLGVGSLFFTYAIISVCIHLSLFWKSVKYPFLMLTIYMSYYYMMHDLVQIRAGVAAGFFMWAIINYAGQKKKQALVFIFLGIFFHYSALAGLVIFLFNNKLYKWETILLYALIPVGLVVYYSNFDITSIIPEQLLGEKLLYYRRLKELGIDEELAGYPLGCNLVIWFNFIVFLFSIYYRKSIFQKCDYIGILIKVQAVAFSAFFFLHGFSSAIAVRIYDYLSVASIFIWYAVIYAFTSIRWGKIFTNLISSIRFPMSMLFYALSIFYL